MVATHHDIASRYRVAGWWTDERLLDRYLRLTARHARALAVADARGAALTHEQLWSASGKIAARLAEHGVGPGAIAVVALPNRTDWQAVFVALLRLEAVPLTIPVTTDPDTIGYLGELSGAGAIVTSAAQRLDLQSAAAVFGVDEDGEVTATPASGAPPNRLTASAGHHLMTTSSTTGPPKIVVHTQNTLGALNAAFAERFALDGTTPIYMGSPLGHSVGAIHGARLALYTGAPLVLQERWDAEQALGLIAHHRCSFTAAATPFLSDLVDAPVDADAVKLETVRWFLCGGAPVPPSLVDRAREEFPRTFASILWGMTEGGVTTCVEDTPFELRRSTAGVGLPGLELCAIDAHGAPLPAGEEGELAMRGPGVFTGYLGQDDLYTHSLTEDGFFRTGDLARVADDGYLRLAGRLKDLVIRGGVNIAPAPIEEALTSHPRVRHVAVIGAPDARLGERLCAVVEPVAGTAPTLDELIAWSREQGLPRRLWPERLELVSELPRTAAGKIRKHELRASLFGDASR